MVKRAILRRKTGKAARLNSKPIKAILLCNIESILAKINNDMINGERMPASWRMLILPYKGKGDMKESTNYRSLKKLENECSESYG